MGSVGDAYDNAMAESFFSTLEAELLSRRRFASQAEAKMACFSYIEGWYNPGAVAFGPGIPLTDNLRSRHAGRHDQDVDCKLTNRPLKRGNLNRVHRVWPT
jgi:hypothetical protein